MVKPLDRSTRVLIADRFNPMIRPPFHCPGIPRFFTSAGRLEIITSSLTCAHASVRALARGMRNPRLAQAAEHIHHRGVATTGDYAQYCAVDYRGEVRRNGIRISMSEKAIGTVTPWSGPPQDSQLRARPAHALPDEAGC